MSNERDTPEERWRAAFTPEARAFRRQQSEESRRERSAAIRQALGKRDTTEEVKDD